MELGDLDRLEAVYRRVGPSTDETAYLTCRIGELEARIRRQAQVSTRSVESPPGNLNG